MPNPPKPMLQAPPPHARRTVNLQDGKEHPERSLRVSGNSLGSSQTPDTKSSLPVPELEGPGS